MDDVLGFHIAHVLEEAAQASYLMEWHINSGLVSHLLNLESVVVLAWLDDILVFEVVEVLGHVVLDFVHLVCVFYRY